MPIAAMQHAVLPFFPVAADDETISSVVARYLVRQDRPSQGAVRELGFSLSTRTDVPLHGFETLISRLLPGHPWATHPDRVLQNHTYAPIFNKLLSRSRREALEAAMSEEPKQFARWMHTTKSVRLAGVGARYCRSCVRRDLENLGFAPYYRQHQIPFVAFCAVHEEMLVYGCARCDYLGREPPWRMAGNCSCSTCTPRPVLERCTPAQTLRLVWISIQASRLLKLSGDLLIDEPTKRIDDVLEAAAIADGTRYRYAWAANAVRKVWTDTLDVLEIPTRRNEGAPCTWFSKCLQPHQFHRDPIRPLMLLAACGQTVEALTQAAPSPVLAAAGAVDHLDTDTAHRALERKRWLEELAARHKCQIWPMAAEAGIPQDTLMTELQRHAVRIPLSRAAIQRIGVERLEHARKMLRQGMQKKEVAEALGLAMWSLQRIVAGEPGLYQEHRGVTNTKRQDTHRGVVLNYMKRHPGASRTEICDALPGNIGWLRRNDRNWLLQTLPPRQVKPKVNKAPRREDLTQQDRSLAAKAREIRRSIATEPGRPRQLSRTRLMRMLLNRVMVPNIQKRMPLLHAALDRQVEDRADYLKRKIRWAVNECERAGHAAALWRIRDLVGIAHSELALYHRCLPSEASSRALRYLNQRARSRVTSESRGHQEKCGLVE